MTELKFKYSEQFYSILSNMDDDIAYDLRNREDRNSTNLVDITDKKQFLKCVIDSHSHKMRCGRVIRRILPNADNRKVEIFVNKFRSKIFDCTFKIVSGEDIHTYYQRDSYLSQHESESGCSLYGSCMTNKPKEIFDIYSENDVRLVILIDNNSGKLLGRALLWDNINGQDVSFLDTCYVAFQSLYYKFKDFAEENDFFHHTNIGDEKMKIQLKKWDFEKYPYCDTFGTLNPDGTVINSGLDYDILTDGEVYKTFDCTEGNCSIHKGHHYYESIKDEVGKYTFDYYSISKCKLDGRTYLKKFINQSGKSPSIHLDYLSLWENRYNEVGRLMEFDIKDVRTKLFILTIREKFDKENLSRRSYMEGVEYFEGLYYKIMGKRNREIIFPVHLGRKVKKSYKWSVESRRKMEMFIRFKLMPSGLKTQVLTSEMENVDAGRFPYGKEILSKIFYRKTAKSVKYFINNQVSEIITDMNRLLN